LTEEQTPWAAFLRMSCGAGPSTNYDERVITEILAGIDGGNFFAGQK
jgi:hypothetical protein